MDSSAGQQSFMAQPFGQEHPSYFGQRQTVSRHLNNEAATRYPTEQEFFHFDYYGPAGMSASRSQDSAQSGSSAQYQITGGSTNIHDPAQEPDVPDEPPTKKRIRYGPGGPRGRGFTGNPKGRPPGARNKPKVPDDGMPKMPKKKGRPLGAKNKHPKKPRNAFTPDSNSSPGESQSSQTSPSATAGNTSVMTPSFPTETQTTYTAPVGYAQFTNFAASLAPDDRGYDEATGGWYSKEARAREVEREKGVEQAIASMTNTTRKASDTSSSSTSTLPEYIMTPMASSSTSTHPEDDTTSMAVPYPPVTTQSYANPVYHEHLHTSDTSSSSTSNLSEDFTTQMASSSTSTEDLTMPMAKPYSSSTSSPYDYGHDLQYPSPPKSDNPFGDGDLTFLNKFMNTTFSSSNVYPSQTLAYRHPTQPTGNITAYGGYDIPAPTVSQADNAASSVTEVNNNFPMPRPCSSIDPGLDTATQDSSPAHWNPSQPKGDITAYGGYDIPAPTTSQADNNSSSVTDVNNSFPMPEPCSSIDPSLDSATQDTLSAVGPLDDNFLENLATEMDNDSYPFGFDGSEQPLPGSIFNDFE